MLRFPFKSNDFQQHIIDEVLLLWAITSFLSLHLQLALKAWLIRKASCMCFLCFLEETISIFFIEVIQNWIPFLTASKIKAVSPPFWRLHLMLFFLQYFWGALIWKAWEFETRIHYVIRMSYICDSLLHLPSARIPLPNLNCGSVFMHFYIEIMCGISKTLTSYESFLSSARFELSLSKISSSFINIILNI